MRLATFTRAYGRVCCGALAVLSACTSADAPAPPCMISSVRVVPLSEALRVGMSVALQAVPVSRDCGASQLVARWSSSAPLIVSVDGAGLATANAPGRAVLRAQVAGVGGDLEVIVDEPVATVQVAPASATMVQGQALQLTATLRDRVGGVLVGREVTWRSLAPASATVSANGVVSALAPDSMVRVVASSEGQTGMSLLRIVPPPALRLSAATVALSATTGSAAAPRSVTISNGGGDVLGNIVVGPVAYDAPASGWLRQALSGATANPTAMVTFQTGTLSLAAGSYTATVPVSADASDSPQSIVVTLTVRAADVASVVVAPSPLVIAVGAKQQMSATIRDAAGTILTGRTVRWSSINPTVAAVDPSTGLLTAAAIGVTSVVATVDGVTGVGFVYTGTSSQFDGNWRGQAGVGRTFAMTVSLGRITSLAIGVGVPNGSPCVLTYSAAPLTLVSGNSFAFGTSGGTANASVTGHFLGTASAQGTYGTITFDNYACPPNLLVTGSVPGGTWTAARQ